jgi:hypothetical protein
LSFDIKMKNWFKAKFGKDKEKVELAKAESPPAVRKEVAASVQPIQHLSPP